MHAEHLSQNRSLLRLAGAIAVALFVSGCHELLFLRTSTVPGPAEQAQATIVVSRWADSIGAEWRLSRRFDGSFKLASYSVPCSANPHSGRVMLEIREAGYYVGLLLRCPISGSPTAAEIAAAFDGLLPYELPHTMHMLSWSFDVYMYSSHVTSGVVFEDVSNNRLRIRVNAPMWSALGYSSREGCTNLPADSRSPAECSVSRRLDAPLVLTMNVSKLGGALD